MTSEYQPGLFEQYPNAPGWKARDTSAQAAADIEPKAGRLQRAVLKVLQSGPQTADDCALLMGEDKLSVRPRFSELSELGLIEDTGQRGFNASGKKAIIWALKP